MLLQGILAPDELLLSLACERKNRNDDERASSQSQWLPIVPTFFSVTAMP